MTISERLITFIRSEELSICEFERLISAGNGYVKRIKNRIKEDRLAEISTKFPHLNIEWLLNGEGEMLQKTDRVKENQAVYSALPTPGKKTISMTDIDYKTVIKAMENDLSNQQQTISSQQQTIHNQQQTINVYRKLIGELCK